MKTVVNVGVSVMICHVLGR